MPDPARPPTFLDSIERLILRAILIALVVLGLLIGFAVWHTKSRQAAMANRPAAAPASSAITLLIDYGDGSQRRFTDLPHAPGMTVMDVMNAAAKHARPLTVMFKGAGEQSLLMQIDDLPNQTPATASGPGGRPLAWQFWINGQYGQVSIGAAKLSPGDRVSWAYRAYEDDPRPPTP